MKSGRITRQIKSKTAEIALDYMAMCLCTPCAPDENKLNLLRDKYTKGY